MTTTDYIYNRKDGGTTHCYGELNESSNFEVACENEYNDGVWTDNENLTTWLQICQHLEKHYNSKIEQIEAI